ncbi:hypothetical protein Lnau_2323 [Legionella nautarum]|uniref:Uncharacterized protein n=1 Tax=Legionella nautarum TaxID=45070 RepID=A0A0W0WML5_9GAMM|nr:PotD/PotF family extracellular solute-binding protein [Legionella nautarum]KTD33572.1 hypothetical protein Lnau_2323 [Legionella nautarum]
MKKLIKLFGLLWLTTSFTNSLAAEKSTVNILSWFGYLRSPEISKLIEKECHATLSVDEYYSNDEFLRRWKAQKDDYDLLVFANLLYKGIKDNITLPEVDLSFISQDYNSVIRQHYVDGNYPKNVVFFSHSLMGFLWNPAVVKLSEQDDMFTVFHKAGANRVILIDDPVEVRNMIGLANNHNQPQLNLKNLQKLVQSSKVTLTNDYNKIYESSDFAFSYIWSGEAVIDTQKARKPYEFLMPPKTSFICTDLLAQVKNRPHTACVARVLASKKAMEILQNVNYYFSPYGNASEVNNPLFKDIYQRTFNELPKYSWLPPVSLKEFKQLEQDWKTLKLEIATTR